MNKIQSQFAPRLRVAAALVLAAACSGAMAADAAKPATAQQEKERAACMDGSSQQDRATCLREAGAASQESKDGKLQATPKNPDALLQNALQRCTNLPPKDRPDCETRARGGGNKEGTVRGGGVVKETVTREVLPRGATVPPDAKQVGTIPAATIPAPPSFASAPN
ncbi:hypothetical protein BH09PSE5_BH09PSE5_07060 [soil metagenome]